MTKSAVTLKNSGYTSSPDVVSAREREALGQAVLSLTQLEQFILPNLPLAQQAILAAQVQRSFYLRIKSETLLTRAQQAVVVASEPSKAAGLALLHAA